MNCPPPLPPDEREIKRARNGLLLNAAGTPGLGSLIAGCKFSGFIQLAMALTGFIFICTWFATLVLQSHALISNQTPPEYPNASKLGLWGGGLFVVSWIWSIVTTVLALRAARRKAETLSSPPL